MDVGDCTHVVITISYECLVSIVLLVATIVECMDVAVCEHVVLRQPRLAVDVHALIAFLVENFVFF